MKGRYAAILVLAGLTGLIVVHPHWLVHDLGVDTQQSWAYDFVSGSGPMILTALGLSTIISGLFHAYNCHVTSCPRIGRYPIAGGQYKVCRKHHPHQQVRESGLTAESLHEVHRDYYN